MKILLILLSLYSLSAQAFFVESEIDNFDANYAESSNSKCRRISSKVWIVVDKSEQKVYLYENQKLFGTAKISTGKIGHETPLMDQNPNGRIYENYTSTKYTEGDYEGLGNMPYAVFIRDGFALHGSLKESIWRLGTTASHGCIRLHPNNAKIVYQLVRHYGASNVWVTVQN